MQRENFKNHDNEDDEKRKSIISEEFARFQPTRSFKLTYALTCNLWKADKSFTTYLILHVFSLSLSLSLSVTHSMRFFYTNMRMDKYIENINEYKFYLKNTTMMIIFELRQIFEIIFINDHLYTLLSTKVFVKFKILSKHLLRASNYMEDSDNSILIKDFLFFVKNDLHRMNILLWSKLSMNGTV